MLNFLINKIISRSKGTGNQTYSADNLPPELIYEVELPKSTNLQEKGRWCKNNIGQMINFWDIKTEGVDLKLDIFIFLNEEDAMAFKLMWS